MVAMIQGVDPLYVNTDVMEPRVVGDSLVSLLRIVPISRMHSYTVSKRIDHIQEVSLLYKEFGTILVDIGDYTGEPVPFVHGKVMVTLHFLQGKAGLFRRWDYKDYYARHAEDAPPYFVGAQHRMGSLLGGLLCSAMRLINRGAVELGKGGLKTGMRIANDVMSGQSTKRRSNAGVRPRAMLTSPLTVRS